MKKHYLVLILFLLIVPFVAGASDWLPKCIADGSCGLDQFWMMFVQIAKWALGLLGVVVLCYFVLGGIIWLTSAGNTNKIKQGRDIMVNTFIGMMIVLGSWLIVNTVIGALGGTQLTDTTQFSNKITSTDCEAATDVNKDCGGGKSGVCLQNTGANNCANVVKKDYFACDVYDTKCKECSGRAFICVNKCGISAITTSGICQNKSTCDVKTNVIKTGYCLGNTAIICCVPK